MTPAEKGCVVFSRKRPYHCVRTRKWTHLLYQHVYAWMCFSLWFYILSEKIDQLRNAVDVKRRVPFAPPSLPSIRVSFLLVVVHHYIFIPTQEGSEIHHEKKKTHAWITSDRSAVRFEWPIGKSRGRSEKKINIFLSFIYLFQWGQQVWRWQNLKGKKRNAFFLFWNSPISAYHFLNISSFLFCRFHCIDIIYTRHRLILLSV